MYLLLDEDGSVQQKSCFTDEDLEYVQRHHLEILRFIDGKFQKVSKESTVNNIIWTDQLVTLWC